MFWLILAIVIIAINKKSALYKYEYIFNLILTYAALYGITMKVADLLNEHEDQRRIVNMGDVIIGIWGLLGLCLS